MRQFQLSQFPFCAYCDAASIVKAATIADHIKPHKGNLSRFYDASNLQSLCKKCHDSIKARIENRSYDFGCDVNGLPVNRKHW